MTATPESVLRHLLNVLCHAVQVAPQSQVSVKLVAQAGIGTVASGVAKANADVIQVCPAVFFDLGRPSVSD